MNDSKDEKEIRKNIKKYQDTLNEGVKDFGAQTYLELQIKQWKKDLKWLKEQRLKNKIL